MDEQVVSMSPARGEPSLTPGEQRILAVLERFQQSVEQRLDRLESRMDRLESRMDRLESRMDRLEQRQEHLEKRMSHLEHRQQAVDDRLVDQSKRLDGLATRIESEGAASKQRDRQVLQSLEQRHQEMHGRELQLRALLAESNLGLRRELSERLEQHNVRLEMLEQAVVQIQQGMRHTEERLREVLGEHRQLVTSLRTSGLLSEPAAASPPAA